MARILIRQAHGGQTRIISDPALPYFLNQGWVVLDDYDDAEDIPPVYLSRAEGDLRWATIADLGDPESAEVVVISEAVADILVDPASGPGADLRAVSVAAAAEDIVDPGTDLGAAAAAAFVAAERARPRGGKFIAAGDSNIGYGYSATQVLDGIAGHIMLASGGRAWFTSNAGVAGDTSAQLLARIDTDVVDAAPDWCHVMIGTNDARGSVPLTTYKANVQAIVAACQAAGIFLTWATVPPNGESSGATATAIKRLVNTYNAWLREYLPTVGVPVVDVYALLVDPATGGIKTAYDLGDQVHINDSGVQVIGQAVWAAAAPYLTAAAPVRGRDAADPTDLLGGAGLFLTDTAGLGTGWTDQGDGHATYSVTTESDVAGRVQQITADGGVGYTVGAFRAIESGFAAGDVLELAATISNTEATGHGATIDLLFPEASASNIMLRFNRTLTRASVRRRFTVPTGVTYFYVRPSAGSAAGTAGFAELTLRDLTALGAL